jgi:Tfp pilus assembly protein PilX
MNQRGFVSILSSIALSILIIIITTGMVALQIKEQRQANNVDLSVRAYFAAQAGVEEAVLDVKNAPISAIPVQNDCSHVSPELNLLGITCQLIFNSTNTLEGVLNREEAAQVDLATLAIRQVDLSWNISGLDTSDLAKAATMELTAVSYPTSGAFSPDQVDLKTVVLRPVTSGVSPASVSISSPGPNDVTCVAADPGNRYNCRASITGLDPLGKFHVVRFHPRFNGTHYRVQFVGPSCSPCSVPDQFVTIDVTARANNVFRRIVTKIPVKAGVSGGLDYVLFSDTDICKDVGIDSSGRLTPGSFYGQGC